VTRRISPPETLGPRAREIVAAARALLEERGRDGLTLRTLAQRLGIRAPSLYNHFPDKASLETAIVASALFELALALETAVGGSPDPARSIAEAYRGYARRHRHVYRLLTDRPLPAELPADIVRRVAAAFAIAAGGDPDRALAMRGFIHGMVMLELTSGVGSESQLVRAWLDGIARF
jgi:AcrR family transcriptional regulator